jgi:hypothetical protein
MESREKKIDQNFESSKFTDLIYETKEIGILEGLSSAQENLRAKHKMISAMQNIKTEARDNIILLEKHSKLYIFKKEKAIFTIETSSRGQDQIGVIFPSGKIDIFNPTSSQEESENSRRNTYNLDTSCIGVSIPKNSTIINIISITLHDAVKNIIELKRNIERSQRTLALTEDDRTAVESRIEVLKKRLENLSTENKNSEKNLHQIQTLLIEKEREITEAETNKQRAIEERLALDSSLESIKVSIESEKKNKEIAESDLNAVKIELTNAHNSMNKIKVEIIDLEQKKSLFDNELSGYSTEGKKQVKIYLSISAIILTILLIATVTTISSGLDLIRNSYDMDMLDILISRLPLTFGISLLISMCFALSYFMINQSIKVNSERMKFMQASIIAKDMWTASEAIAELTPQEREKLRQQAKIQLIAKIFEEGGKYKYDHKIIDALFDKLLKKE